MSSAVKFHLKDHILAFDDGGMTYSNPDNTGFKVDTKVYNRLLKLAKENDIKIQIACNAAFFDIDNISGLGTVNTEIEKIIKILDDNREFLEVWNHGLNHMYENETTEFYSYTKGSINKAYQREHLELSIDIFKKIGLNSTTFVPPGHAWESGVTDKIASKLGFQYIAVREFEKSQLKDWMKNPFKPYKMQWKESKYLTCLFRLGLGIPFNQVDFDSKTESKMKTYVSNKFPSTLVTNRKLKLKYPVDHFFAHIQNLQSPSSVPYFDRIIKHILKQKR